MFHSTDVQIITNRQLFISRRLKAILGDPMFVNNRLFFCTYEKKGKVFDIVSIGNVDRQQFQIAALLIHWDGEDIRGCE